MISRHPLMAAQFLSFCSLLFAGCHTWPVDSLRGERVVQEKKPDGNAEGQKTSTAPAI
jgi:hypothetical protein